MIKKVLQNAFAIVLISCGVMGVLYTSIFLVSSVNAAITNANAPFCDEIYNNKPRPLGIRIYCKDREVKSLEKIKIDTFILNLIWFCLFIVSVLINIVAKREIDGLKNKYSHVPPVLMGIISAYPKENDENFKQKEKINYLLMKEYAELKLKEKKEA